MPLLTAYTDVTTTDQTLTFVANGMPTYVANALRRFLLAELPVVGIPNTYRDEQAPATDASPGVSVRNNTGRLHNEYLRHRLSLLPVALDPAALQRHRLVFTLQKSCAADQEDPIPVTSEDIRLCRVEVDGNLTVIEDVSPYLHPGATAVIPCYAPTDPSVTRGILLTRLYPDEAVDLTMYPCVGIAREFAGFAPLHTCTYEHLLADGTSADEVGAPIDAPTAAFRFTIQTLGVIAPNTIVSTGWQRLQHKVDTFKWALEPNTIELEFGASWPSLDTHLRVSEKRCWVQWSNVDFLTSLHEDEGFYQQRCREVLVVTTSPDERLVADTPYTERVPTVDGEDIVDAGALVQGPASRFVLALHQAEFAQTGLYEYDKPTRTFAFSSGIKDLDATFYVVKEGRSKRAQVFTPATMVSVLGSRCVLRFGKALSPKVFEHVSTHIKAVVCADANGAPVHLTSPSVTRAPLVVTPVHDRQDASQVAEVRDDAHGYMLTVDHEDHTLGNLFQGYVYDKYLATASKATTKTDLVAIGYNQPLPSEKKIQFRLEFATPKREEEMRAYVGEELAALNAEVARVGTQWEAV